ncbi:cysteine-rich receptor-like protein kinase 25 isoform X3 [Lotus japonicus]|nr:cysteine-rich receptor-like protein kinase 25 isoform X3 [Lotus japonicus]
MVRYSTTSLFSTMVKDTSFKMHNSGNVSNPASFKRLLLDTINKTVDLAALPPIGDKKFATTEVPFTGHETLYILAQCTPDLSPLDCRTCLSAMVGALPNCCEGKVGGRVASPSCNIRYELYPFFYHPSVSSSSVLALSPNTSRADSPDPTYLSHNCSTNKNFTANSTFQTHITTLLSYLSSNSTNTKFHKADVGGTVYGLFMCQFDLPPHLCQKCVSDAIHQTPSVCGTAQEAVIWYTHCMFRYSNGNFFYKVDTSSVYSDLNITSNNTSIYKMEQNMIVRIAKTVDNAAIQAGDSDERHGTVSSKLNDGLTLYALAQCTHDLAINDCKGCLGVVIGEAIPWTYLGSIGGRVMYPSCSLRFELFLFYKEPNNSLSPNGVPSSAREKNHGQLRTIVLIVVGVIIILMAASFVGYCMLRRKAKKSYTTIIKENLCEEFATLEPLHFDLAMIKAATNNFANENKIGKGGFGEVYKGIFLDGRQIAVKRLSSSSTQGANEFKNEILLIAKLQHRNLVAFIGFCLEEEEKILIYEYVTNRSLDYFLFDSQQPKPLSWVERYSIIKGIAQGITYLHEHSRLKVIHRDLKPSNVLLDENMIPKISDFGLARIVEINQDQESTHRIVGTYGYMSPEYAMLGHFSEKSDVFSFGVMILEIITGKKNLSSYELHRVMNGLLSYVWRQWKDQAPLTILDPTIKEAFFEFEVIKCIHIGLLCVQENPDARPTMTTIVSYLSSHSIELPTPQEPAFSSRRMSAQLTAQELSSFQSIKTSTIFSTNEMPISEFIPR